MPQDYDSAYKAFYERLFQKWNIPVETEVEVSRQAKKIDGNVSDLFILFLNHKLSCFAACHRHPAANGFFLFFPLAVKASAYRAIASPP